MSCSAEARSFLKTSRILVKAHRWVLVSMSLNCKISGLNGRLPAKFKLKKTKESLHGPNCVRKWRRKILFLWFLSIITVGSILLFLNLNYGTLGREERTPGSCEVKAPILQHHFNASEDQLVALATLVSKSDQVLPLCLLQTLPVFRFLSLILQLKGSYRNFLLFLTNIGVNGFFVHPIVFEINAY